MSKLFNLFNALTARNRPAIINSVDYGVSQTVPDQALPLRTLIERYTRGQEVRVFTPTFDNGDMPDVSRLDALEKVELARTIKREIAEFQKGNRKITDLVNDTPNPQKSTDIDIIDGA